MRFSKLLINYLDVDISRVVHFNLEDWFNSLTQSEIEQLFDFCEAIINNNSKEAIQEDLTNLVIHLLAVEKKPQQETMTFAIEEIQSAITGLIMSISMYFNKKNGFIKVKNPLSILIENYEVQLTEKGLDIKESIKHQLH